MADILGWSKDVVKDLLMLGWSCICLRLKRSLILRRNQSQILFNTPASPPSLSSSLFFLSSLLPPLKAPDPQPAACRKSCIPIYQFFYSCWYRETVYWRDCTIRSSSSADYRSPWRRSEGTQSSPEDMIAIWTQTAGGMNKGRVYGIEVQSSSSHPPTTLFTGASVFQEDIEVMHQKVDQMSQEFQATQALIQKLLKKKSKKGAAMESESEEETETE
uniref:Uncharacterized protein n=1 Tax=Nicotiana tabacum TaxID=4097 RepID=A0A1S4BTR5_TOBAC|nr:PREDICTED: uncharacterized protein LOC107811786 [Nicotiana tabacum]